MAEDDQHSGRSPDGCRRLADQIGLKGGVSRETLLNLMESTAEERDRANLEGREVRALVTRYLDISHFLPVAAQFLDRIERLAALIALWGARINLTAAPEDPREIAFHIIDSLAPLTFLEGERLLRDAFRAGSRVLDLGSGAGFPGLVLAASSSASFTLVESRRKRASFLAVAAAEMGLKNAAVEWRRPNKQPAVMGLSLTARGRRAQRSERGFTLPGGARRAQNNDPLWGAAPHLPLTGGEFDAVTARAFGTPSVFHSIAAPALKPHGIAILYATPGQDLALPDAEKAGLRDFRRLAYSTPRDGHLVERILGVWRRR
jgi:16S rRNA G527 N7-methylase RsmG